MSLIPEDLRYSKEHEWVRVEGELARVGISDFAQSELGDIVFAELPKVGEKVQVDVSFGTIESVKTVSDLFAPVSGEVVEVNGSLEDAPELVNSAPYADGWLIVVRMAHPEEVDRLLSAAEYSELAP